MATFDREQVFDYIATADSWINLNDSLGEINIRSLIEPLIDSINSEGGVSYVLEKKERYRSSTLATVLDALADVQLLPLSAIHQMQDHLYDLKSEFIPLTESDDKVEKAPEDQYAWGIDETPSVWTTSMAIIALMDTRYVARDDIKSAARIDLRNTVYWLADQAYDEGGWGYQKYEKSSACRPCVSMTALAMKAILLAQNDTHLFNDDARRDRKFNRIVNALNKGKKYLLDCIKEDESGDAFWEYQNKPGVGISMWAIDALNLFAKSTVQGYRKEDYDAIEPKVISFIYKNLPTSANFEQYGQSELFFIATQEDGGLKYKPTLAHPKGFYTFRPYIVSSLLDRGENPANEQIVLMIRWLLKNRDQHWAIEEYNSSSPCSISAAMAINVIVKWLKKISEKSFSQTVNLLVNNEVKTIGCEYGLPCSKQFLEKPKKGLIVLLALVWIVSVFSVAFVISSPQVRTFVTDLYKERRNIIIGAGGSILAALIIWLLGIGKKIINIISEKLKLGGNNE